VRQTFEDWVGDDDDVNGFYTEQKYSRKKQNKKNKQQKKDYDEPPAEENWDEQYEFTKPTDYRKYKGSSEDYRNRAEWKAYLHKHQRAAKRSREDTKDSEEQARARFRPNGQFLLYCYRVYQANARKLRLHLLRSRLRRVTTLLTTILS